jgi:hypothetical protein
MSIPWITALSLTGILILSIKLFNKFKSRTPTLVKPNLSKYKELLNTLAPIDKILDQKLRLGKAGVTLDLEFFDQQVEVLFLVSSGKLAIFGASFTKEIMDIVNDAEFDIVSVENASIYVKNEISKLQKLV